MKPTYRRLKDKSDRTNFGTNTIQTSGNLDLIADSILVEDYTIHTYQVVPIGAGPWTATFKVEVSNDGENYSCITSIPITNGTDHVAYSDNWAFAYARASVVGDDGEFLINERHLS